MKIIRLPRLGQTMETGIINLWCFEEGDQFTSGEPLYEVETEKMTSEVEARLDGRLVRVLTPVGDEVPVGAMLAVTTDVEEVVSDADIDAFIRENSEDMPEESAPEVESVPEEEPVAEVAYGGVQTEESFSPGLSNIQTGRILAVPKARAVAKELDVDLTSVQGSGHEGVIRVADVRAAGSTSQARQSYAGPARVAERIPVRGVTRAMADAVSRSWREIPQFVQQVSLDGTALVARLKRLKYEGLQITFTDLLVGAVAAAAQEVPAVNATFTPEEIIRFSDVNVSLAVATERGLVVPVVRQAHQLSIGQIGAETKALAARAREGKLTAADTTDGTITVSNLGAFGVDTGTPIVNAPQSAIVFVGSMGDQAVVRNGRIVVRTMLNIAIAYDHRVVDGMTGAQFTSALKSKLEAGG